MIDLGRPHLTVAECVARNELDGFERRLGEAREAYQRKHGHQPPHGWEARHRARFDAWRLAKRETPDLRFGEWAERYLAQAVRDASDAFGDIDEDRLRAAG